VPLVRTAGERAGKRSAGRALARGALLGVVILTASCGGEAAVSAECTALVDKILACDPSAAGVSRSTLEPQCAGAPMRCAAMDTSTPAGCTAFMGCLYGD
jgi:hypothetical protein